MKCYISKNYKGFNAGNKAKTDIEQILENHGFRNIGLPQTRSDSKISGFFHTLASVRKAVRTFGKGDVVVLQYPFKKYYESICRKARRRGVTVITVIHDLGSFRSKKLTVRQEIDRLNHSDYVIASNRSMQRWLEENGCQARLGALHLFDYLSETRAGEYPVSETPRIVYAGALSPRKNEFLYHIEPFIWGYRMELYGGGFDEAAVKDPSKITYNGFVPSDELICQSRGEYGLVWDGPSVATCTGDLGEYLQYNSPHKASLYLRCGLPLIIWADSGIAYFVKEHNIGLTVDSLESLSDVLSAVTPEQYAVMKANACRIGRQISEGHFILQAVERAMDEII